MATGSEVPKVLQAALTHLRSGTGAHTSDCTQVWSIADAVHLARLRLGAGNATTEFFTAALACEPVSFPPRAQLMCMPIATRQQVRFMWLAFLVEFAKTASDKPAMIVPKE